MGNDTVEGIFDGITNNISENIDGWEILKKIITAGGWITDKIITWVQGININLNQPAGLYQVFIGIASLIGIWFIFKAERKLRWYIRWGLILILVWILIGQFS